MAQSRSFSAAWRWGSLVGLACALTALSAAITEARADDELALASVSGPVPSLPAAALPAGDGGSLIGRAAATASSPQDEPHTVQVVALTGRLEHDADHPFAFSDARGSRELVGVSYRVWTSRGPARLGLGLGALGRAAATPPEAGDAAAAPRTLAEAAPVISVAMHYRVGEHAALFADASLAHALRGAEGLGNYTNAKVGVEWQAAKPRLGFERGRLGLQLDSGYRMSLRIRKSGLGIYLRGRF